MTIARAAAKAMLSDALLQEGPGINRINHLELELPLDKVIKFVSVGLPLMLVCMAFAREISLGEPLSVSVPYIDIYLKKKLVRTYIFVFCFLLRHLIFHIYVLWLSELSGALPFSTVLLMNCL